LKTIIIIITILFIKLYSISGQVLSSNVGVDYFISNRSDTLLLEKCQYRTYSMCSDGYEQSYRIFPVMIKYNKRRGVNFFDSYSDTVFMYYSKSIKEVFNLKYDKYFEDDIYTLDKSDTVNISPEKFFIKKIKKFYAANHIEDKRFKVFTYSVTTNRVKSFYGGKLIIYIPDFSKEMNKLVTLIETNLVLIVPD